MTRKTAGRVFRDKGILRELVAILTLVAAVSFTFGALLTYTWKSLWVGAWIAVIVSSWGVVNLTTYIVERLKNESK